KPCNTEDHCKNFPFFAKTFHDKIHGATLNISFTILPSVHNCESTGEKFGRHSYHCAHPHPEDGTWPAYCNGYRNTCNIPHSHSRRQCCSKCLEMANLTGIIRIIVF